MRKWLGITASVLFGIVAALLIAEVGVRIVNRRFPYFYCFDPVRGWGLRPNVYGYYRQEGASFVSINSGGFRGPEISKAKPPGTIRIAVIGDSYTQAIQVPYDDTFTAVAGRALADCPLVKGRRVEALDFGVDGYGTAQEMLTLERQVWDYSPDIVVIAIFLGNDIRNNSVQLEGDQCRPFYVYQNDKLVLAGPFTDSPSFRLWCMTRFEYRSGGLLSLCRNAFAIILSRNQQPTPQYPEERAINYNIYKPPADQAWRDAWRVTEGLLVQTAAEVKARHAAFLAVTLDTGIQVWPDPAVRENFQRHLGVADLFYPDRRIAALGGRAGFAVLTLAQPLQQYAEAHHAYLHGFFNGPKGFGHWNAEGHREAGLLIAKKLCDMIGAGDCPTCAAPPASLPAKTAQ